MLTDFDTENDGFFALSAKLIINTTDLFTVVRNTWRGWLTGLGALTRPLDQ